MLDILRIDRGDTVEQRQEHRAQWLALSRLGNFKAGERSVSLWFQLHGTSQIDAREGSFLLRRGDWMLLERDSAPQAQAGRDALLLGIVIPASLWNEALHRLPPHAVPLPGRGRLCASERRIALRLWRQGAQTTLTDIQRQRRLHMLLQHLTAQQPETRELLLRCPGRSWQRKRQMLVRLQCARLFLEGNSHRIVTLTELADLTHLSVWHFAKTFQQLYQESPLALAHRLRLDRACTLLTTTGQAISEVGWACGFDSGCSFARAFRARYGMTPSRFRITRPSPAPASRNRPIRQTEAPDLCYY